MEFYTRNENSATCLLCRHYCKIKPDHTGICGVNKNIGDKIECLVYGRPAAINVDPVEKKPLYHFLPGTKTFSLGTVGCNFKCPFCQNWQISQSHDINMQRFVSPKEVVESALFHECDSIAYTYNEPTIFYPYAKDIAVLGQKRGLKSIFVTNGFESIEVIDDMQGVIDALNVDLKSFNRDYYKKVLKGGLHAILNNLVAMKERNLWLEITTLIVPEQNDSKKELAQIAKFIADNLGSETPWHISAFHPDYKQQDLPPTSIKALEKAQKIGYDAGLRHIYLGNIGKENPTQCTKCGKKLIKRSGFGVEKNFLEKGRCPKCGTPLAGVFT